MSGNTCEDNWNAYLALRAQRMRAAASSTDAARNFVNPTTPFRVSGLRRDITERLYGDLTAHEVQVRRKYEALKCLSTADVSSGGKKNRTRFSTNGARNHLLRRILCADDASPGTLAPLRGRGSRPVTIDPLMTYFPNNP